MRWECAECGGQVTLSRRPTVCPFCGIGGALFVPAGNDPEDGALDRGMREAWLDYGMNWAGRPLFEVPGLSENIAA